MENVVIKGIPFTVDVKPVDCTVIQYGQALIYPDVYDITVTVGDCVHKFTSKKQLNKFYEFLASLKGNDYILDVRDYVEGLVI